MQTWIEPIPYLNWNGFVDEISDPENNDEVHIIFSGRKIDFQDLQYAKIPVLDINMNIKKCWMIRFSLRILRK